MSAVLLGVLFLVAATPGEQQTRDFTAANERALSGDLPGAIALYQHLIEADVRSEDVYYNLGNAYAESGKLVEATVAYERAIRLAPWDDDARANLATVRAKLRGPVPKEAPPDEEARPGLADVIDPLVAPLSPEVFGWITVIANLGFFGLMLVRRWAAGEGPRRLAAIGIVVSLVALVGAGTVVLGHSVVARDPRGVALENLETKEGPHPRFRVKGRVRAGTRVRILESELDWIQVQDPSGASGWVPATSVQRV